MPGSNRAYPANTKHSANNSQNVPDLVLLYENICITFGEYSISGNIIHKFYECYYFNNSQSIRSSIPDLFLSWKHLHNVRGI